MRRLPYAEAIARFGTDRRAPRFGLEDWTSTSSGTPWRRPSSRSFARFSILAEAVRGINAGARELPRSALDGLIARAQELGAKGLVWAFREGDGWRSPTTAKFLSAAELSALKQESRREGG